MKNVLKAIPADRHGWRFENLAEVFAPQKIRRQQLAWMLIAVLLVIGFVGCDSGTSPNGNDDITVTGVTLDKSTLSLIVGGDPATLTATVSPSNATNKAVTWSTSNDSIATVANGVVTPVAAGSATITVTTTDGNKTATCAVTVNPAAAGDNGTVNSPTYVWLSESETAVGSAATTTNLGPAGSVTINPASGYTAVKWYVNGEEVTVEGTSYTFSAEGRNDGIYNVVLVAQKGAKYYDVNIKVTVTN